MTRVQLPIEDIWLLWQQRPHTPRRAVGVLDRKSDGTVEFAYVIGEDLDAAMSEGFSGYPGFPVSDGPFSRNVMASFATRLPDRDRPDFQALLRYWDAEVEASDVFGILAATGGTLPTDNFEFVPRLRPERGVQFLTGVAGFVHADDGDLLKGATEGDCVGLVRNPSTPTDRFGVEVTFNAHHVGWIKRVHSENVCRALEAGLDVVAQIRNLMLNGVLRSVRLTIRYN